jgi:acetyltransferase-like isoleucine patch superfamily enzyme
MKMASPSPIQASLVSATALQIGTGVYIYTVDNTSILSLRELVKVGHPVRIGEKCWICGSMVILIGLTIGDESTVGVGSVVTKNIPPFSVAMCGRAEGRGLINRLRRK